MLPRTASETLWLTTSCTAMNGASAFSLSVKRHVGSESVAHSLLGSSRMAVMTRTRNAAGDGVEIRSTAVDVRIAAIFSSKKRRSRPTRAVHGPRWRLSIAIDDKEYRTLGLICHKTSRFQRQ